MCGVPDCGLKIEKVDQLPSKAPFSKRFEEAVGEACESASARRVAKRFGLGGKHGARHRSAGTWNAGMHNARSRALQQMGVDEIFLGKKTKFVTVVSNLETGEPLWFGLERKKETLDEFFRTELSARQRQRIESACVDMWEPFTGQHSRVGRRTAPSSTTSSTSCSTPTRPSMKCGARSSSARAARCASVVKGKRWLLLTRWVHLNSDKRQQLNQLFSLNRKVMKAYLLKESLERLWTYTYEGAMLRYLKSWTLQLRWQRLPAFEKLAHMLIDHVDGILNYCRVKVRFGVVEAINGNIKTPATARPRLQEPTLPAAQGSAHGRHQNRIRRVPESRVKWASCRILAQSLISSGTAFKDVEIYALPEVISFVKTNGKTSVDDHNRMGPEAPSEIVVPQNVVKPGVETIDGVRKYIFDRVTDTEIDFLLTIRLPELAARGRNHSTGKRPGNRAES